MSTPGISVAVVGLGFGQDFVPIYLSHPDVARMILVEPDADRLREVSQRFGISESHSDIEAALADPTIDAVHLLVPVHLHADLSVAVLNAGKHCGCAVPMATSLEDIDRVIVAQAGSGKNYMMMETSVFGREYLTVEEMYRHGEIGAVTLYSGFQVQNLDGYPPYWQGYPPMHYLTHALSPALALLDTTVESVQCQGAGRLTADRAGDYSNPFPTEVGLFRLAGSDALAVITMSFFQTARSYLEGFSLYGEHGGIEWPPDNEGDLLRFDMSPPAPGTRGNAVESNRMPPQDFPELFALRPPAGSPEPVRCSSPECLPQRRSVRTTAGRIPTWSPSSSPASARDGRRESMSTALPSGQRPASVPTSQHYRRGEQSTSLPMLSRPSPRHSS
jgi:predicted dehydrogenase